MARFKHILCPEWLRKTWEKLRLHCDGQWNLPAKILIKEGNIFRNCQAWKYTTHSNALLVSIPSSRNVRLAQKGACRFSVFLSQRHGIFAGMFRRRPDHIRRHPKISKELFVRVSITLKCSGMLESWVLKGRGKLDSLGARRDNQTLLDGSFFGNVQSRIATNPR